LMAMVAEELRVDLRQTIDEAKRTRLSVRKRGLRLRSGRQLELEIVPFTVASSRQRLLVVLFKAEPDAADRRPDPAAPSEPGDAVERALRAELASTREYLQSVIEQLEAGNEELKASHEEVVSSNEELQSLNEELQTAQEELYASNQELSQRVVDATRLSDDLGNVLTSAAIPIVILEKDARVRRVTPAASRLFRLLPTDVGRPIGEIKPRLNLPDLAQLVTDVITHLAPTERTVQDDEGHWYELRVRPYVTGDSRIDGAVLAVFDVDRLKKGEQQLTEARAYAEGIVDTVREGLVVIDGDRRIVSANRSFYGMLGTTPAGTIGKELTDLGRGGRNDLDLVPVLDALRNGEQIKDFRVEADLPRAGSRALLINGRRIAKVDASEPLLLLTFADVTERERAERTLRLAEITAVRAEDDATIREYQTKLQDMAFDAALAEEHERRRIAGHLHDNIGQSLALAQMKLASVSALAVGEVQGAIVAAIELLQRSIAETRSLTFELSPPILYDLGLPAALAWLADQFEHRYGLHVEIEGGRDGIPGLESDVAAMLFRWVRELFMNVVKHAQAKVVTVALHREDGQVRVEVADDGAGFDPSLSSSWADDGGFGLFSVREQTNRLGGVFEIKSSPGQGTQVLLRVPLGKESARPKELEA
jgi:PAS domain S-box-containing protein